MPLSTKSLGRAYLFRVTRTFFSRYPVASSAFSVCIKVAAEGLP